MSKEMNFLGTSERKIRGALQASTQRAFMAKNAPKVIELLRLVPSYVLATSDDPELLKLCADIRDLVAEIDKL